MPYSDPEKAKQSGRERQRRYRAKLKSLGIKHESTDETRARQCEAMRRYRERQRALGLKPKPESDERKIKKREYVARRRQEAAKVGVTLPSDAWRAQNPDRHRENTTRWRSDNRERWRHITRLSQGKRRSTPWGTINNRLWPVMHGAVRRNSSRPSKYTLALGYLWSALRAHLEAQFTAEMSWENWGDVWELDHIQPVSAFKYTSLDDALFKQAWSMKNLRPLLRIENAKKGNKKTPT